MPGLDGREKERVVAGARHSPDGDVARPAFGNRRGISSGDHRVSPCAGDVLVAMNPGEARREQAGVTERRVHWLDGVHHAELLTRDGLALPVGRAVRVDRRRAVVVGRLRRRAGEWRIHQPSLAVAIDVPSEAVRRRTPIDFAHRPRLRRIGTVGENRNDTRTLIGARREAGRDRDLGDAVAVEIGRRNVDQTREARREDVTRPRRIFEPDQFRQVARDRDQIGFAVAIEIGGDDLIAAAEACRDFVRRKSRKRRLVGGSRRNRPGRGQRRASHDHNQHCAESDSHSTTSNRNVWSLTSVRG